MAKKNQSNKIDNETIVNDTLELLWENREIVESIYAGYADEILKKEKDYIEKAGKFQVRGEISKYSSITLIKNGKYDLRFAGQSIGTVKVIKKRNGEYEPRLEIKQEQSERALLFGYKGSEPFDSTLWDEKKCQNFRSFFSNLNSNDNLAIHTKEHRIENFILDCFSEKSTKNKLLPYIQPVLLGGQYFQFTTPLKASKHLPTISIGVKVSRRTGEKSYYATGGGIDILARNIKSPGNWRYTIIELKDENKPTESQATVMTQALIYATFMAFLFRSKSGKDWWNIFRNPPKNEKYDKQKSVPEHIDLDVVTLMPSGDSSEGIMDDIETDKLFPKLHLNTTLHLYTLYYKTDAQGNPCAIDEKSTFHKSLFSK